jgi:HSP20 family protein
MTSLIRFRNNIEDDLFRAFFEGRGNLKERNRGFANVINTDRGYTIEMIVPGFSKSDINITTENGVLTVSGDIDNENKNYTSFEYDFSSFNRSFTIPEGVNVDNINADYDAGILSINIPVHNENNIRKIIEIS